MKYGIQSMDSGCDYTEFDTLEECKNWVLSYRWALERDNAKYIQIINAEDAEDDEVMIFYENVKWDDDGNSNLKDIPERIASLKELDN